MLVTCLISRCRDFLGPPVDMLLISLFGGVVLGIRPCLQMPFVEHSYVGLRNSSPFTVWSVPNDILRYLILPPRGHDLRPFDQPNRSTAGK